VVILQRPSIYNPTLWRVVLSPGSECGSLCCSSSVNACHLISACLNIYSLKVLMSWLHSAATSNGLSFSTGLASGSFISFMLFFHTSTGLAPYPLIFSSAFISWASYCFASANLFSSFCSRYINALRWLYVSNIKIWEPSHPSVVRAPAALLQLRAFRFEKYRAREYIFHY